MHRLNGVKTTGSAFAIVITLSTLSVINSFLFYIPRLIPTPLSSMQQNFRPLRLRLYVCKDLNNKFLRFSILYEESSLESLTNFPNLKNLRLWSIFNLHCNTWMSKDHQFLLPDLINPKCDDLSERFPISRLSFSSSFYCQHGISHPRQVKSCFLYHYLPFGFNLHIIVPFNQNSRIASLESHFIPFTSWILLTNTAFVLQITAIYTYKIGQKWKLPYLKW